MSASDSTPPDRSFDIADLLALPSARGAKRDVLIWSSILMTVEGYDMQIMGSAAPSMIASTGADKAAFAWVFSLGLLGYMVGALTLGGLGDRIGRKVTICMGTALFGVATLAIAWQHALVPIVLLRFVAGVGIGAVLPATIAFNAEFGRMTERGRRIGIMYVGYTLGGAASGVIAALLLPRTGWPVLFVIGGLLPLVIASGFWFSVSESPRFLAMRDGRSAELLWVMRKLAPALELMPADRITTADGGEARHGSVRDLFKEGRAVLTLVIWTAFVLDFVTLHLLTNWLPTAVTGSGLSHSQAALAGAAFQIGGTFGAVLVGHLLDRFGVAAITVMLMASVPLIAAVGQAGPHVVLLAAIIILAGTALQGGQSGFNAVAATCYPTAIRTTGAGWAMGIGRLGSMIGPLLGGALLNEGIDNRVLFAVAAAPVFFGAVCTFLLLGSRGSAGRALARTMRG